MLSLLMPLHYAYIFHADMLLAMAVATLRLI